MTDETQTKGVVLLVDDDKFLLDMYVMKFTAMGYTANACLSAKEAVILLRGNFNPDAILFDITMPELDGFTFLKAVADEHLASASIKIALTNQNDESERMKIADLGATRYIVKANMIPSEVVNTITEELAKRRA